MSKYEPLRRFLAAAEGREMSLTFAQVDLLVGGLPRSAREYPAWWANADPSHDHCRSWGDAGYTAHPDLGAEVVTFLPGIVPPVPVTH